MATPNHHLLAHNGQILLTEGPTENGHRPAINALFRSVALTHGRRAVGLLLSGVLDDGVLGSAGVIDHCLPAAEVGGLLKELADRELEECEMQPDARMELENRIALARRFSTEFDAEALGAPSGYTCPDCNGTLITISDGNYRCHVGHAWTADALLNARDDEVDSALWVALRSLQEKAKLSRRLADQVSPGMLNARYNALADEAEHAMSVLGKRLSDAYREQDQAHG